MIWHRRRTSTEDNSNDEVFRKKTKCALLHNSRKSWLKNLAQITTKDVLLNFTLPGHAEDRESKETAGNLYNKYLREDILGRQNDKTY